MGGRVAECGDHTLKKLNFELVAESGRTDTEEYKNLNGRRRRTDTEKMKIRTNGRRQRADTDEMKILNWWHSGSGHGIGGANGQQTILWPLAP